eukprot:1145191-Pelagomonas_calceolata.AAC.2
MSSGVFKLPVVSVNASLFTLSLICGVMPARAMHAPYKFHLFSLLASWTKTSPSDESLGPIGLQRKGGHAVARPPLACPSRRHGGRAVTAPPLACPVCGHACARGGAGHAGRCGWGRGVWSE